MKRAWLIVAVVAIAAIATAYAMTRIGAVPKPVIAPQGVAVPRPPGDIVAVHMRADEPQRAVAQIGERFPDAVPFTVLLEKKFY